MIPKLDEAPPIPNLSEQATRTSFPYNRSSPSGSMGNHNNNNDREDDRIPKSTYYNESSSRRKLSKSKSLSSPSERKKSSSSSSSQSSYKPKVSRRNSIESCSSINSMEEFPTVQEALHNTTANNNNNNNTEDNTNTSCTSTSNSSSSTSNSTTAAHAHHVSPLSTSSSPPPRSTSKAVSFNKRVRIRKIKRLEDMSLEEIQATYFTDTDLIEIRNGLRANIRVLVENNYREDQHETVEDYWSSDDDNSVEADIDIDDTATFNNNNAPQATTAKSSSSFCIRGLEHEFPQGKFRRKQLKMMSRGAVLEEQRLQREFNVGRNNKHSKSSLSSHSTSTTSTYDSSIRSFVTTTTNSTGTVNTEGSSSSKGKLIGGVIIDEDADVAISEIYRIESKPAVQLALEFAKRDEAIADQIYFAHQAV